MGERQIAKKIFVKDVEGYKTMIPQVSVAVFPVAGLGTRFLPVTKSSPKEMLPIIDRPLIQYAVDEAIEAGIKHLVFVTNSNKHSLEDYFDTHYELEQRLQAAGKQELLDTVHQILPSDVKVTYVRQGQPLGLGHAILQAEHVVGDQAFAVLLADDFMVSVPGCLAQLCAVYEQTGASVVATQHKLDEQLHQYGVVGLVSGGSDINCIVEKPKTRKDAPSNFAVMGRYVLNSCIFNALRQTPAGVGGEIQLTDAIGSLLKQERVLAHPFSGHRYDCGQAMGYLEATIDQALERSDLSASIMSFLRKKLSSDVK